jgi:transcription elongation factor GreA
VENKMSTVPITKYGAELLKEELARLKSKERPSVINAIAEARAQGDLSENAEYEAAKERQAFVEGRIADLEGKLGSSLIVDPTTLHADGRVVFAATVDLENLETGEHVTYQIVGIDEADIKESKVSITSPIARALIGKSEGDVVEAPSGLREYEILGVRYI